MENNMPNCPLCGAFDHIELSESPEEGSHFCIECAAFFTPPADSIVRYEYVPYQTLSPRFLTLMEEIGLYGLDKYGERSTEARFSKGDFSRDDRTKSREIARHAANHFEEYLDGVKHDKFNTREHQLAAAAFNAMLEYQFFIEGR